MDELLQFLDQHKISFERFDHPAVFTCEQAREHLTNVHGAALKNLFLRDRDGKRHLLVVVPEEKQVNLKALSGSLGVDRMSFASAERLKRFLGVDPGSVTILGLINDRDRKVEVYIDRELASQESWQCHPLVNTATLVIQSQAVQHFIELSGHSFKFVDVPAANEEARA